MATIINNCQNKKRYTSFAEAEEGAYKSLEHPDNTSIRKLEAYRCNICEGYHLTSKISKKKGNKVYEI
jgi:hypothetical protein